MKIKLLLSICLFAALVGKAQQKVIQLYPGAAPGSESWNWEENDTTLAKTGIVYNVSHPSLTVFPADAANNTGTAAIICPGGGFHILSINSEGNDVARWLAKRGVTCFVLKYRLVHSSDPLKELMVGLTGDRKKFNELVAPTVTLGVADARAAIAYVRQHADELGIKADKIGIVGFSAGGTLTEATAFDYTPDNKPNFVAPIYAYVPETQATNVAKDAPPMFLTVASDDELQLAPTSILLYNKWLAAGKTVEMHLYAKGGHGFGMKKQNIPADGWIDRFGDWLQQQGFIGAPKVPPMDWPWLGRFAADNAKVQLPAKGEKRVVFMGNSITEGWLRTDPAFFDGKPYINRGISGQTTPQMVLRFRQDVIDLKPKVVIILAGTNDIAGNTGPATLEQIMGNLASMAELAKAHSIKVVLSSVLPVFDYPWKPGLQPADKIIALNAMIKDYCAKNGCVYLDYWTAMADARKGLPLTLAADGVHPNMAGYKIMEPLAEKAIADAMK